MKRHLLCLPLFTLAACADAPGEERSSLGATAAGLVAHAGGEVTAVAVDGERAILAVGPRVTVWDVSDLAAPVEIGAAAPAPSVLTGVAVSGDRVYASSRTDLAGRLHVHDISDPSQPRETQSVALALPGVPSAPLGVAVAGGRVYVADQERGVAVLELETPDSPQLVHWIEEPGVNGVKIVGARAYVLAASFFGASVHIYDVAGEPVYLGSATIPGVKDFAATPSHVLVGTGIFGTFVFDVSDPAAPAERFADWELAAFTVAVSGDRAFVSGDDGITVIDLATATPSGPFPAPTAGARVSDLDGDALVVSTSRGLLLTVDAAGAVPAPRGATDSSLCVDCLGTDASEGTLYIASFAGGLRAADVHDLTLLGGSRHRAELPVFEDVAVSGDHIYVADWGFGLRVFDRALAEVGSLVTGGFPSSVAVASGRAYVGEGTNGGALHVIDVSAPERPVALGAVATSKARHVEVRGTLAFVGDEGLPGAPGGLRIFDVADPTTPRLVGHYTGCTSVLDVALEGNQAVLACASEGFHLVDITRPRRPRRVWAWAAPSPGAAWSVAAWPGRVALGHDFGVIVLDVTRPQRARTIATLPTAWTARSLIRPFAGRLIAACGPGGVYAWDVD